MRKITKGAEPVELTEYKKNYPSDDYYDLKSKDKLAYIAIREACLKEQYYLCSYCCDSISANSEVCHIEHIIPQTHFVGKNLTLEYTNMLACCQSHTHCGHFKKNNLIPLIPLDPKCETEIIYQSNGKMKSKGPDAQRTISTLNLQETGLVRNRKQIFDLIIFEYVEDLSDISMENEAFILEMLCELEKPDEDGKMGKFIPPVISAVRYLLNTSLGSK